MWRVVFYERRNNRVQLDKTGPWLPQRQLAMDWAQWFSAQGYFVALQHQSGELERLCEGLPG
ncbi:hypothetical protein RQP53_20120 [Paucibacter sp. APW11]|uniref:Uncharacterized protein n=1 Tax=Roseateles aquae TaxID=3077235 RepID=A0ABU3PG67_9BURK|nr:hypothetical protein [Paucibacter sp. APW11]MDT9001594.1 hypothetical protein [Paucibacter sp. APW11]